MFEESLKGVSRKFMGVSRQFQRRVKGRHHNSKTGKFGDNVSDWLAAHPTLGSDCTLTC